MTTRRRNIAPDDAMRPCAVCSGKKGCSHRRSNEAPGFSRAGGYVPWYAPRQYRAMPRSRHCPAMPAESNVRPRLSGLPFDSAFLLLVIDHINDINAAIYKNRAIVGRDALSRGVAAALWIPTKRRRRTRKNCPVASRRRCGYPLGAYRTPTHCATLLTPTRPAEAGGCV